MRLWVPAQARDFGWLLLLATLLAPASSTSAQSFSPPSAQPAERVAIPADALPPAISSLLEKGRTLEATGRWAEALSYYEEALREHPQDRFLQDRFDVARLHYSLEQRYADRSFRDSVQTLRAQQSLELYRDLLDKINAHYYTTPPWQSLVRRGSQSLDIALADDTFVQRNSIRATRAQIDQVRPELRQLAERYAIRSSNDAAAVASHVARLANQRLGLSETASLLEFTAAAATALDPYSAYLTADQLRDIYSQIEGNFVGLGVELKAADGALLIVHVIPNSPAERAGIRDGDRIVAVDGQATRDLSTEEAASLLTGEEGSLVRVSVETAGQPHRELAVRRAHVEVPSLEGAKIIDPQTGVAYVRIPAFQKTTARDLEAALWDLHRQGMRSLIIDLRGNPGGLLTASVEVADKFIASGPIVSTRGRSEQENFNYQAHRPGTWRVPLVVLIDGDSASASEIFAGAIKDSGRGKIVGSRSYGKGSVQGIFPLTAGAGARLTTASFYSPHGHPISKVGITPDIDPRLARSVAESAAGLADGTHLVGFRGAPTPTPQASTGTPAARSSAAPTVGEKDEDLGVAIQVAQMEPVASL